MDTMLPAVSHKDVAQKLPLHPAKLQIWQHFHIRLTGLYAGAVFIALVAIGILFYRLGADAELEGLKRRLLTTATAIAFSVDVEKLSSIPADSIETTPFHRKLFEYFKRVASADPDIESIYLLRSTAARTQFRFLVDYVKEGRMGTPGELYEARNLPVLLLGVAAPVVEDKPYTDEFGTTLSGYAPLRSGDGGSIGLVGVDVKVSRIAAITHQVMFTVLAVFGVAMFLLVLISMMGARNVREPISLITEAMSDVSRGKLDTRLNLKRSDEFGLMSFYFDRMAEGLQEREFIRETFGRYMSEDVARALLERRELVKLGGEERIVTVLFSDLEGYSTISEQLTPTQVVEMLNSYLGAMSELIDTHHGCVLEFLGDAILAVFGAPHHDADHCAQAVRCALAMRDRVKTLNEEWRRTGLARYLKESGVEQLNVRIGIHTGRVVAGNLGSPTMMKYTVIGDAVNLAERLEQLNKELGSTILVSGEVRADLPEDLRRKMVSRGEHTVKGREQPVSVYSPG